MKTFKTLFLSLLAVAFLASCEKEPVDNGETPDTPETKGLTIIALTDGVLVPEWAAGDVIKIACGENSYDFKAAAAGKSATFTGDGTLTAEMVGDNPVTAYFNCSSARGAFRISGEQTYKDGKTSASVPMYAYTMNAPQDNSLAMTFKPLASVLRVALPVHPISIEKITVKPAEGATVGEGAIAGTYTVNAAEGTVAVNNDAEMVEVTFDTPLDVTAGGTVDIPVGWFAVSGGLDITLVYDSVKEMKHTVGVDETFKSYADADGIKTGNVVPVEFEMDMNSFPRAYYVTVDASETGKGVKWSEPATLDYALENAMAGSSIHVAAGTYKPAKALPYTSEEEIVLTDVHKGFAVNRNVTIIGGYPASPSEGAVADASVNKTILDGDGKSWHVMVVGAPKTAGEKVVIEGLTITNGYNLEENVYNLVYGEGDAAVSFIGNKAAGLGLVNTEVELRNVTVTANSGFQAAGVFGYHAKVSMTDCVVSDNVAASNGGGVWFDNGCEIVMDRCEISGNSTSAIVGGLYLNVGENQTLKSDIRNTVIADNTATSNHGGMYVRDGSGVHGLEAEFTGCTISGNKAAMGAAFHVLNAEVGFHDCMIADNEGSNNGVVLIYDNCDVVFDGCTFKGNKLASGKGGSAIYAYTNADAAEYSISILNTAFHSNKSGGKGTVWCRGDKGKGVLNVVNCTFHDNAANNVGSAINVYKNITVNLVSNTIVGNISDYAKDAARAGAICLEAAPLTVNSYNNIIAGNLRIFDGVNEDIKVKAGTVTNKYCFVGSEYYGADGAVSSAAPAFDYTTMVGAFANGVMKLVGTDNPALTYGMPAAELKGLANDWVSSEVLGKDQLGTSRGGSVAGACVTQ